MESHCVLQPERSNRLKDFLQSARTETTNKGNIGFKNFDSSLQLLLNSLYNISRVPETENTLAIFIISAYKPGAESTCASLLSTQVRCWMMCVSLSAAGTGDALWIQRSPSAAPRWTTAHSGAGRGNYTGGWLQTLRCSKDRCQESVKHNLIFRFQHSFFHFSAPLHCQVLTHSSAEAIPALGSFLELEKGTNEGFSLLLKDHDLQQYFPDVLALEREELL